MRQSCGSGRELASTAGGRARRARSGRVGESGTRKSRGRARERRRTLPRLALLVAVEHLAPDRLAGRARCGCRADGDVHADADDAGRLAHGRRAVALLGVALDLLVVRLAARRARPAVARLGLGRERRVDARQVEDAGAARAGDRLGPAGRGAGVSVGAVRGGGWRERGRRTHLAAHLRQTQHPRWASHSSAAVPTSHRTNSKLSLRWRTTSAARGGGEGQLGERGTWGERRRRDARGAFETL
mgnify:CR=1 FL=1